MLIEQLEKWVGIAQLDSLKQPFPEEETNQVQKMAKDNLTQLLSQLNVQSTKDEPAKAEETCLKLLEGGCTNPGAIFRTCLVAIIKQDKYQRGVDLLFSYKHIDEKYGDQFALEKLYIYYKLNKTTDFEKLYSTVNPIQLGSIVKQSERQTKKLRGLLHLRAQFCYKHGLYEETFKIYHYLASHNEENTDNSLELSCNERVALTVEPYLQGDSLLSTQIEESSYDLLFNDSMVLSARGKYEDAIEILKKAHALVIKDGYESDIDAIELQLAFVYQMQGNGKHSQELLQKLLKRLEPGSPFYILAKTNQQAFVDFSKYATNLNLVLRELNTEKMNSINLKQFTHEQWSILNRNCLFLHLFNNNSIQSKSTILSRTLYNYKNLVDNVVFETYKTQAKKTYHHAVTIINSGTDGSAIGFLLLTLQFQIVEKQWDNAIRLCELFLNKLWRSSNNNMKDQHHTVCCVLFELYNITGRSHSKSILLMKLQSEKKSISKDSPFWKHVGFQHLELGDLKNAKKLLKEVSSHNNDKLIKKFLSEEPPNLDEGIEITNSIDVEALIAAGTKPLESSSKVDKQSTMSKIQKKRLDLRKKKKRAQKIKKFLLTRDPNKIPDPERWMSIKDRSSYRSKRKQQLVKQTQGGAINKKAEQALDISKKIKKSSASKNKKKAGK